MTQDRGVLKVLSPSLQADHAILRAAHETVKGAKPENKEDREMRGTLLAMGYTEAQIESALACGQLMEFDAGRGGKAYGNAAPAGHP